MRKEASLSSIPARLATPLDRDEWNDALSRTIGPFRVRSDGPGQLWGRLNSHHDTGIGLVDIAASAHSSTWVKEMAAGPWAGRYMMTLIVSGELHVQSQAMTGDFGPGDIGFIGSEHPGVVDVGEGYRALCLTFSAADLPLDRNLRSGLSGLKIPSTSSLAPVISGLLQSLSGTLSTMEPMLQRGVLSSALEIVATIARGELGGPPIDRARDDRSLAIAKAQRYILDRLHDPELDVASVAKAHFVSTRYIHMLFDEIGETPGAWIRAQRFEGARKDLGDPLQERTTIAAIAAKWGYATASHFGQTFKNLTGMTPTEYRSHALDGMGHSGLSTSR